MLKIDFHEGFTASLLSGTIEYDGKVGVSYRVKGLGIEPKVGSFEVPKTYSSLYQNVVTHIDQFNDTYESNWDDLGGESLAIKTETIERAIEIKGPVEQSELSQYELPLFELKNFLRRELYNRV